MIKNDAQLLQARAAVVSLERSLVTLKRDYGDVHPDQYALMADPILEDLRQLRQNIDEYVGKVTAANGSSQTDRSTSVA